MTTCEVILLVKAIHAVILAKNMSQACLKIVGQAPVLSWCESNKNKSAGFWISNFSIDTRSTWTSSKRRGYMMSIYIYIYIYMTSKTQCWKGCLYDLQHIVFFKGCWTTPQNRTVINQAPIWLQVLSICPLIIVLKGKSSTISLGRPSKIMRKSLKYREI